MTQFVAVCVLKILDELSQRSQAVKHIPGGSQEDILERNQEIFHFKKK